MVGFMVARLYMVSFVRNQQTFFQMAASFHIPTFSHLREPSRMNEINKKGSLP
jgi:hypothetical protein